MPESFLERVETSYRNTQSQEALRILEMRIGELAPGALPDFSDLTGAGVALVIRATSPLVFMIVLGKEWIIEIVSKVRERFHKVDIQPGIETKELLDTDFPQHAEIDPNHYINWKNTHERYLP